MTNAELARLIMGELKLTEKQATELLIAVWENIARELSVGESVDIDGLGKFYTVKYPGETIEDPPGSGKTRITLPEIEPEFDPDQILVKRVQKEMEAHPELFPEVPDEDEVEDDETAQEKPVEVDSLTSKGQAEKPMEKSDKEERAEAASEQPAAQVVKEKTVGRPSDVPILDVANVKVDKEILSLVPENIAKKYEAVPVDLQEGVLTVAMTDPEDFDAIQMLRKETGLVIKPGLTNKEDLATVLDQYTGLQAELQEVIENSDLGITKKDIEAASEEDIQDQADDNAPTAKIVSSLLKRAVKEHASDIHIEPYERKVVVRFRIDGILMPKVELPKEIQPAIIARLKILANLKIDEQRLPQDGRFSLILDKRQVDFRFSTIPVVYGEKVVMRILDKSVGILKLEDIGLTDHGFSVMEKNLKRSHGMILITGPTGSGKTTSLYAILGRLISPDVNILTLEDPVEYRVESINQSQVHTEIGYTFATGLRAVVRQDPDIVMLGEIRDHETADMAIHAALTGHVVLSTLHTNDAAGAFPRLIDMGIEPFLITSSLHTVVGQRLTRKICQHCTEPVELSKEEMAEVEAEIEKMSAEAKDLLHKEGLHFSHGKGCDACNGKGYQGRIGVYEVLDLSETIRDLVLKRSSGTEINQQAIKEGMVTMIQDGITKAARGMTTLEEVWRVTRE